MRQSQYIMDNDELQGAIDKAYESLKHCSTNIAMEMIERYLEKLIEIQCYRAKLIKELK